MPVLTYPANTPVVFSYTPSNLTIKTATAISKASFPAVTPTKVGLVGGVSRPTTGQIYPRGDR